MDDLTFQKIRVRLMLSADKGLETLSNEFDTLKDKVRQMSQEQKKELVRYKDILKKQSLKINITEGNES